MNNCVDDSQQEQGKVIIGGADCVVRRSGASRAAFAYSSPGWQQERGRVDVIVEGSEQSAPLVCPGLGPVIPEEDPIPVAPGDSELPAAQVEVNGKTVTVRLPLLEPSLSGENYEKALRKLQRKEGLTKGEARKALRRLEVIYEVKITPVTAAGAASLGRVEALGRSSWGRRSKRNRMTTNDLRPGSYALTWRAVIATKRPPVEIGAAVSRFTTKFTVPGRK